jgi:hypothetical protein
MYSYGLSIPVYKGADEGLYLSSRLVVLSYITCHVIGITGREGIGPPQGMSFGHLLLRYDGAERAFLVFVESPDALLGGLGTIPLQRT